MMSHTELHSMKAAVMDTGSGMTLTTEKSDFIYLDKSTAAQESLTVLEPSVGTPKCGGRGPAAYPFLDGHRQMVIIDPKGA